MTDLIAFLNARLDEDESRARATMRMGAPPWSEVGRGERIPEMAHIERHSPARVLREIEADRELLRRYVDMARNADERRAEGHPSPAVENMRDAFYVAVLIRAAVHNDHPDYMQEWKP